MTRTQSTSPGTLSAAAQVAAERYGVIGIEGDRAVLIAALHTIVNWLIDHPGIPCPQDVELIFHPRAGVRPNAHDLVHLAHELDGAVCASGPTQWVVKRIPLGEGAAGVKAKYTAFGEDRKYADQAQ
jgi:hypothetical protein